MPLRKPDAYACFCRACGWSQGRRFNKRAGKHSVTDVWRGRHARDLKIFELNTERAADVFRARNIVTKLDHEVFKRAFTGLLGYSASDRREGRPKSNYPGVRLQSFSAWSCPTGYVRLTSRGFFTCLRKSTFDWISLVGRHYLLSRGYEVDALYLLPTPEDLLGFWYHLHEMEDRPSAAALCVHPGEAKSLVRFCRPKTVFAFPRESDRVFMSRYLFDNGLGRAKFIIREPHSFRRGAATALLDARRYGMSVEEYLERNVL